MSREMPAFFKEAVQWSGTAPAFEVAPMSDGLIAFCVGAGVVAVSAVGALIAASVAHADPALGFMVVLAVLGAGAAVFVWATK